MDQSSATDFWDRDIDASINILCWLAFLPCTFGAIPYKTTLRLDNEEVTKMDSDLCGHHVSKRPYGELGSVDHGKCFCFVHVESAFGPISPGCGCDDEKVDDIVNELRHRMRQRGDTAQIQRAEETVMRLDQVNEKLDLIMEHLNISSEAKSQKIDDRE